MIRVVSDLQDLDKKIINSKAQLLELCTGDSTSRLTTNDIFLLFLWTLSANFEGQISKSGLKYTTKPQFSVTINSETQLRPSFEQFYRTMRKYFLTVQLADTQSKALMEEFQALFQQLMDGELFKRPEVHVNKTELTPEEK